MSAPIPPPVTAPPPAPATAADGNEQKYEVVLGAHRNAASKVLLNGAEVTMKSHVYGVCDYSCFTAFAVVLRTGSGGDGKGHKIEVYAESSPGGFEGKPVLVYENPMPFSSPHASTIVKTGVRVSLSGGVTSVIYRHVDVTRLEPGAAPTAPAFQTTTGMSPTAMELMALATAPDDSDSDYDSAGSAGGAGKGASSSSKLPDLMEQHVNDTERLVDSLLAKPPACVLPDQRGDGRGRRSSSSRSGGRWTQHLWAPAASREDFLKTVHKWSESEHLQRVVSVCSVLKTLYARQCVVALLATGPNNTLVKFLEKQSAVTAAGEGGGTEAAGGLSAGLSSLAPPPSRLETQASTMGFTGMTLQRGDSAVSEVAADSDADPEAQALLDSFLRLIVLRSPDANGSMGPLGAVSPNGLAAASPEVQLRPTLLRILPSMHSLVPKSTKPSSARPALSAAPPALSAGALGEAGEDEEEEEEDPEMLKLALAMSLEGAQDDGVTEEPSAASDEGDAAAAEDAAKDAVVPAILPASDSDAAVLGALWRFLMTRAKSHIAAAVDSNHNSNMWDGNGDHSYTDAQANGLPAVRFVEWLTKLQIGSCAPGSGGPASPELDLFETWAVAFRSGEWRKGRGRLARDFCGFRDGLPNHGRPLRNYPRRAPSL